MIGNEPNINVRYILLVGAEHNINVRYITLVGTAVYFNSMKLFGH